jgi:TonB-dependent starch-binding outer membrane protein SusC
VNDGDPSGACSWPGAQWYQSYHLGVRGGGQALQYYISGQYQNDQYTLPNDRLEKYNFQGNFTMSPIENLQLQWNTGYTDQWTQNTPTGNNLSGIELQTFRQERNYFAHGDPRIVGEIMDYVYETTIERLTTGATATYSPISNLTNRFTVGYDHIMREGLNQMPFNYWELPEGMTAMNVYNRRLLTFDYVSTLRFGLTESISSNFSWGGQANGDDEHRVHAQGENFPGAVEPTVSSGALQRASEDREKVWNAGFFLQNVLDIKNRYFITGGLRVDGNSAFGEGFGLQMYPKASLSWVMSDEGFWAPGWGTIKLRAAYGQSGRAPGAFDAVRTWDPVGYAGLPAFRPENVGNPNLGPEVTGEFEAGLDGAWLQDRLKLAFTYFRQKTTDALLDVSQMPSTGFTQSQLENVGTLSNKGMEIQLDASALNRPSWGLDLGLGISTNHSMAEDIGDLPDFSALSGRISQGYPVPAAWDDRRVANRDSIGPFRYVRCEQTDEERAANRACDQGRGIFIGALYPTQFVTPSMSLRVPGNITISARGEYRGGHHREVNEISISRSVRSPICFPYYIDATKDIALKPDTPALWRERCTSSAGDDYWFDADYFKLRNVSATIPMDFAFPERVGNPTLTLTLNNFYDWYREVPWYDMEMGGDTGARSEDVAEQTERTPAPATFRLSLRATF